MTTVLDTDLLDELFDAIQNEIGRAATLVTYPSMSTDAVESEVSLGTAVEYAVKVSPPQTVRDYKDDALSVPREVQSVFLPAKGLAVVPTQSTITNCELRIGSVTYKILRVQEASGGDVPCGWELFLEV